MTTPTLNNVELPDDVIWSDRLSYSPVEQTITPTLTGGVIVEENSLLSGRPITLKGVGSLSLVEQFKTFESVLNLQMPLVLLDGSTHTVIFKRPGVSATPLMGEFADPYSTDPYEFVLNLMEVE